MSQSQDQQPIQFIRELCKGKSEKEILEAESNFRRYLAVVKRICQRMGRERRRHQGFDEDINI